MVYCGKPSKGCSNCRERKIRCDQRQPGCAQCEKRQKQCPGYRNLVDLMFRDESSQVIKKANARARKGTSPSDNTAIPPDHVVLTPTTSQRSPTGSDPSTSPERLPRTSTVSSASTAEPRKQQDAVIPRRQWSHPSSSPKRDNEGSEGSKDRECREVLAKGRGKPPSLDVLGPLFYSLSPSFQERGLNLFVGRYITMSENLAHHRYDFVLDLWQPSTSDSVQDPVLAGVTAVGLVGVAEMNRSNQVLDAARRSYGKALYLTNAALRDPVEAVKDTTMLSVLILGLFELVGGSRTRGIESWQKHLSGAAALARMRGMGQFRRPAGIRLFFMLTQNTMISCIQNELPMPGDLLEMREQLGAMLGSREQPGYEVCTAMYKILQLRYDIKQGIVPDLEEMLDRFTDAEDHFERVISNLPEAWQYRRYRLAQRPRPGFFNNIYHVYPSLQIARVWNGLRTCRLLILETMIEDLRERFLRVPVGLVPQRHQFEYQKAKFKMEMIASAILASVPQHFGLADTVDDNQDALAPLTSADDLWSQIPGTNWAAELGSGSETSDSGGTADEDNYCRSPSLNNPMQAKDAEARAERFMLLSSVTNNIVWPLYLVGMSSASSISMRAFAVERLHAIHAETGVVQAGELAGVVATHGRFTELQGQSPKACEPTCNSGWKTQYAEDSQRTTMLPV